MLKKPLSLLLALCIIICAAAPAFAETGPRYRVSVPRAVVLKEPSVMSEVVAELPQGTVVTENAREGSFIRFYLPSEGLTGWVHLGNLTPLPSGPSDMTGITVSRLPDKTVYVEGEEAFVSDGLVVTASFKDGTTRELKGYTLLVPAFNTYGEKTVEVLYTDAGVTFFASFAVTVVKVPVASVTLLTPPDKTEYIENQPLDLTGLTLRVAYLDGRPDEIRSAADVVADPAFSILGCHSETPGGKVPFGSHTLQIVYRYPEFSVSFSVTARRRVMTGLSILTPPDSLTVYRRDEVPALSGMTLEAKYDNGETQILSPADCEILCDPAAFVIGEGNRVTLSYGGFSVSVDLTYLPDEPAGIRIQTPTKLYFTLGEPIDLRDLKVCVRYLSGREVEVTDYTLSPVDPKMTAAQTLTVTYGSYAGVFTIFISPYYRRGDIDNDAAVTAADARYALRTAVGLMTLGGQAFTAADADRDGQITAADARLILRCAVDLEDLGIYEVLLPQTA